MFFIYFQVSHSWFLFFIFFFSDNHLKESTQSYAKLRIIHNSQLNPPKHFSLLFSVRMFLNWYWNVNQASSHVMNLYLNDFSSHLHFTDFYHHFAILLQTHIPSLWRKFVFPSPQSLFKSPQGCDSFRLFSFPLWDFYFSHK